MRVTLRYFAVLREQKGRDTEEMDVPEGTTAAAAYRLACAPAAVRVAFAVNTEMVPAHTVLRAGDELALLPPLGGG